jgi:hypothetical protein
MEKPSPSMDVPSMEEGLGGSDDRSGSTGLGFLMQCLT